MASKAGARALGLGLARLLDDLVSPVVKPAMKHVAGGKGHWPDTEAGRSGRRRFDAVAVITGAAAREDAADGALGASACAGAGPGTLHRLPDLGDGAGTISASVELGRPLRSSLAVKGAKIGHNLLRRAVA